MRYFTPKELLCTHVYEKYGDAGLIYVDSRLIITLETLRERIGRPIYVNWGGLSQRGLRCILCPLVKAKIEAGELYLSAHLFGKAFDCSVQGMDSESVREWIILHANSFPYPLRLERDVSWVHVDLFNDSDEKVILFNS